VAGLLERGRARFARPVAGVLAALGVVVVAGVAIAVSVAGAAPARSMTAVRLPDTGYLDRVTAVSYPSASTMSTSSPSPTATVVPSAARVAAAAAWIRTRRGVVGFAVVDSSGHLSGYHVNTRFVTASVVKAMLLVGYLRTHPTLSSWARSTLMTMIHVSDNSCATAIYDIVGDSGLRKVAKAAGMQNFSVAYSWGRAQLTPADQARFFYEMDRLIPAKYVTFARSLLSHITSTQSWGIPATARPAGWTVFFKGGWRGTTRGQLVHQIARLEGHGVTFSMAVMTDGDPSMAYGEATISGVTKRLLGL
jgi:hypothetical protein